MQPPPSPWGPTSSFSSRSSASKVVGRAGVDAKYPDSPPGFVLSAATIQPASLIFTLNFTSIVASQSIQVFAHWILIYICITLRGVRRSTVAIGFATAIISAGGGVSQCLAAFELFVSRGPTTKSRIEGTLALGIALLVNLTLIVGFGRSPPMRLPAAVLATVALLQAGGISFWLTSNGWTSLLVQPIANIYLAAVLLAVQRSSKTYTIRSGICTHAVRDNMNVSRTSFVFDTSPPASLHERTGSRDNLTDPTISSSRWSRDTSDFKRRGLFSRKPKRREGVAAAAVPSLPSTQNRPPPVSQLVKSVPPPVSSQSPPSPSIYEKSVYDVDIRTQHIPGNVPAAYLVPNSDTPYSFVESRPYPGLFRTPSVPRLQPPPASKSPSPTPFQNLNPPPLLPNTTITAEHAAEILGMRIMDYDSASGVSSERDVDFIVAPQASQRLWNPYSPVPSESLVDVSSRSFTKSPPALTIQNLSVQERQLSERRDGRWRPRRDSSYSEQLSEQGSATDPDVFAAMPTGPLNFKKKGNERTRRLNTVTEE
ncbi:hypothetical protein P7C70_g4651, partial [Phenoliferia sp. Uapishka_3]